MQFELNLYRRVYAKGVYIYISGNSNRGTSPSEHVRGLPGPILDRVKKLTHASSDAQAVVSWDLPREFEPCNSCHSQSRMQTPSGPDWARGNSDWLIGTGGAGRLKNFNDPRFVPELSNWLQQSSKSSK